MKITKKANLALLVMLTAVSILPGCGKSKNAEQIGGGVVVAPPGNVYPNPGNGGSGCASVAIAGDGSMTFPIYGNSSNGVSVFYASTYVGGSGFTGGNYYHRANMMGDIIDLVLSGGVNSAGTVSATVHLSPTTVTALGGFTTGFCIQRVDFNGTSVTTGSPGTMFGGIVMYTSNGYVAL